MKTKFLFFIICSFLTLQAFTQSLAKWGELRNYEKQMTVCSFDSTAEAVVLSDFQRVDIYTTGITIKHHKRIKILKDNAKDRANIIIPYYHGNGLEDITSIKAQTINLENGKPIKRSLKSKEFFRTKVDEVWSNLVFTFPEVRAGSIIEFEYTKSSFSYSSFTKWSFQSDIPTLFSQITAYIGRSFRYKIYYQGGRLVEKYKEGAYDTWLMTNLPKIKKEPFCPNYHDYIEQINFQCESRITSIGTREIIMKSWEEFAKDLLVESEFTKILNKENKVKDVIYSVINEGDTPIEKIKKIFNYVSSNFTWDNHIGLYPDKNLKELQEQKGGSAQEINTYLILLLRSAGLEADPLLISSKDHGIVSKSLPFKYQFNYLICNVHLDGKDLILDASKGKKPYNLLDKNNLNQHGFLVHKDASRWVDIKVNSKTRTYKLVSMEFGNPEEIQYKLDVSFRAYDAQDMREGISSVGVEKYILNELIREKAEIAIDSFSTKDLEDLEKPTFISAYIRDRNLCMANDDYVYLNPFVDAFDDSNPFNESERYLPIDLYYPFEEGYILNLTISDEYEVIEFPKSMNVKLSGDKGFLNFYSSLNNNKIQLRINLILKESFFLQNEYSTLKELFDLYIEKRQEQIVLKKKV